MPIHVGCLFSYGCILSDVVVVIELGAYIHGVLTFNGCLLSQFITMTESRSQHKPKIADSIPSRNWVWYMSLLLLARVANYHAV